jgi:hypothetical protein
MWLITHHTTSPHTTKNTDRCCRGGCCVRHHQYTDDWMGLIIMSRLDLICHMSSLGVQPPKNQPVLSIHQIPFSVPTSIPPLLIAAFSIGLFSCRALLARSAGDRWRGVTDGFWGERRSREMFLVGQTALEKVFLIQNGRHDFAVKNFIREALRG